MFKEKIRQDFIEAMDEVMKKIFFDARMLATVDIMTWEESSQVIKDAVDNAYLKYRMMNAHDYAEECINDFMETVIAYGKDND